MLQTSGKASECKQCNRKSHWLHLAYPPTVLSCAMEAQRKSDDSCLHPKSIQESIPFQAQTDLSGKTDNLLQFKERNKYVHMCMHVCEEERLSE